MKEPLDDVTVRRLVTQILSTGTVIPTKHATLKMVERNMDMQDCLNVLRGGFVAGCDPGTPSWTYRIATLKMTVVVAFRGEDRVVIVTAWRNE